MHLPTSPSLASFWPRLLLASLVATCDGVLPAQAVTHESPEVLELVEKGLAYLDGKTDERLGGKCLVGLAYKKAGRPASHPQIKAAVSACENSLSEASGEKYIYSKALAIIFLSELDAQRYQGLIKKYAAMLDTHRKPHGGYGYTSDPLGDTSQTQYAALASWEMLQTGLRPDGQAMAACTNWLLRTQAPDGAWGYRGRDPGNWERQDQLSTSPCMLSAGLSSVLICSDMLGVLKPGGGMANAEDVALPRNLPPGLRPVVSRQRKRAQRLDGGGAVDRARVDKAWQDGRQWLDKNFTPDNGGYYSCYYLYALERYKSFEEYLEGDAPVEPKWYNAGYDYLKSNQKADGSWISAGESRPVCSTAFGILFLLRSTKGSLANLGVGTLVGGRGLPRDLSKASLKNGRLVVEAKPTEVDDLLKLIDEGEGDALEALLENPAALKVTNVGAEEARRLQQIVRSGDPAARLLAVEALSRLRDLEYAPTLIFALSDPDPRVVRAARDGLRFVSRRVEGFGLPDDYEDRQRYLVIDQWKNWYRMARPQAPPLP